MDHAQKFITLALGATALVAVVVGYFRSWLPRWRRWTARFEGAVDVLFGRPEIVDPASRTVLSPKLPSLGERLVTFDQDIEYVKASVVPVAADVAEVKKQVTENHHSNPEPTLPDRLSDVRSDVSDLHDDVRLMMQAQTAHLDWSQEWTSRMEQQGDNHEARLNAHEARLAALEAAWPPRLDTSAG